MRFFINHAHLLIEVDMPRSVSREHYFHHLEKIFIDEQHDAVDARIRMELEHDPSIKADEEFDPRDLVVSLEDRRTLRFSSDLLHGEVRFPENGSGTYTGHFKTVSRMAYIMASLSLMVSTIAVERRMVLLHSSVVDLGSGALMFLGDSGTGKTTAANILVEALKWVRVLSFDSSIMTVEGGGIGESPRVHLNPSLIDVTRGVHSSRKDVPAVALVEIAGWGRNELVELDRMEGLNVLVRNLMYWNVSRESYLKLLKILEEVVSSIPVYSMFFERNGRFAEMIQAQFGREGRGT